MDVKAEESHDEVQIGSHNAADWTLEQRKATMKSKKTGFKVSISHLTLKPVYYILKSILYILDSKNLLYFITHLVRITYSIMKNWCCSDFFNCVRNFDIAYLAKLVYKLEISH